MNRMQREPRKTTPKEVMELGRHYRDLSNLEKTRELEVEVFCTFSKVIVCSPDQVASETAEKERASIHWNRESFLG